MKNAILLLAMLVLSLMLAGCGDSDTQQEPASGKTGAADDTSGLCLSIEGTGLAKQCAANSRGNTIDVMIDSYDDEVARNICADIAHKTTQLTAHISGLWRLQVFSPYRRDKPMATCLLH